MGDRSFKTEPGASVTRSLTETRSSGNSVKTSISQSRMRSRRGSAGKLNIRDFFCERSVAICFVSRSSNEFGQDQAEIAFRIRQIRFKAQRGELFGRPKSLQHRGGLDSGARSDGQARDGPDCFGLLHNELRRCRASLLLRSRTRSRSALPAFPAPPISNSMMGKTRSRSISTVTSPDEHCTTKQNAGTAATCSCTDV